MSRLTRFTQRIFGLNATGSRIAVYGSLAAGSPTAYSGSAITPALVQQQLAQFELGLDGAVIATGGSPPASPALQDHNALFYLYSYQLAYLFQQGIPEYATLTTYYVNSIVMDGGGVLYQSINTDPAGFSNIPPSNGSYWVLLGDFIGQDMSSVGADAIGSTMTSAGANAIGSTMTAVGADAVAASRTRGSGSAVGIGGIAITASSGAFATSSGSFVPVTNLGLSIQTSGRPVQLMLIPDSVSPSAAITTLNSSGNAAAAEYLIQRDGSVSIAISILNSSGNVSDTTNGISVPPGTISMVDFPSAGTHTYNVQVLSILGTAHVTFCKLVAYEL